MSKTTSVRALMDPKKKENVSKILTRIGINHSEAINILYSLIEEYNGFPFELRLPENNISAPSIRPEVVTQLKESIKKNKRLGELLAK